MKKPHKKNGPKVFSGNGKAYSAVSREMEGTFARWLEASGVAETALMEALNGGEFELRKELDADGNISISLYKGEESIVLPLVWFREGDVSWQSFRVDSALLLLLVASKCGNRESKKKIEHFIKTALRENSDESC